MKKSTILKDSNIMKLYEDLYWAILYSQINKEEKMKILKALKHVLDLYIASFINLYKISQSTDNADND